MTVRLSRLNKVSDFSELGLCDQHVCMVQGLQEYWLSIVTMSFITDGCYSFNWLKLFTPTPKITTDGIIQWLG